MGDGVQPEIEVTPHWITPTEETREQVLKSLDRNEWRPEIERTRQEPSLAEEKLWCDPELFEKLVEAKKKLNEYDANDVEAVRKRANPHEPLLENRLMIGRYSILLASIDRVTDFLLTQENIEDAVTKRPLDTRPRGTNINREEEMFYFAESQTLPIPFASQYVWLRKGFYNAKCFSPQLAPTSPLCALVSHALMDTVKRVAHKRSDEKEETCNPYDPAVREAFMDLILRGTRGEGVHLYTGFTHNTSPYRESWDETTPLVSDAVKELLFRDSYVAQLLYATRVMRKGGRAILHFLDTNTSLSMAVLYLAHIIFDRVSIYKPNMSRPASSERFLICDGLRQREAKAVRKYLEESMDKVRQGESLIRLIPDNVINEDESFLQYTMDANNQLVERQLKFLDLYCRMLNDEGIENTHQKNCLETCLPYYLIPYATQDEMRNMHMEMKKRTGMDILSLWIPDKIGLKGDVAAATLIRTLSSPTPKLSHQLFREKVESGVRLLVTPLADSATSLMVVTNNGIEFWSGQSKEWVGMSRFTTVLPPDTILLGDVIPAPDGRTLIVRILDVGVIFGDDISTLPFKKRMQAAEKMIEATRKDGARQDVCLTMAIYEEIDVKWKPSPNGRVVENDIYLFKYKDRIIEDSSASFFKMVSGESVWEV